MINDSVLSAVVAAKLNEFVAISGIDEELMDEAGERWS